MPSAEMSRSPIRRHHHHRSKSPIRDQRRSSPRRRSPKPLKDREKERSPTHRSGNDRHKRALEDEDSRSRHRSREHESKEKHRSRENESHRSRESEKGSHRSRESEKERHRSSKEHEMERHREKKEVQGEDLIGRSERRSERDSRSKRNRSVSPINRERNVRNNSDDSPRKVSRRTNSDDSAPRVSRSGGRNEVTSPRGEEHRDEDDSVAKMKAAEEALEAKKKEEPSYELSGKLAAETNRVKGVTLLFTEPSDARKSDIRWRLYVFKGGEMQQEPLYIHRQTCYLFGRERRVADVPTDHPSCSKQHAVLQFRQVEKEQPDGMLKKQIGPYLMDLGSTNGTFLNETRIEPQRYYELFEKDTIKFGNSSREYVMLHENSAE